MVDPAFPEHRKVKRLARELKIHRIQAFGHIVALWCRVMLESPTGDIKGWSEEDISDAAGWDGDGKTLVKALKVAKLLDKTAVHDWVEHQGNILEKRESWKQYKAEQRKKASSSPANVHSGQVVESLKTGSGHAVESTESPHDVHTMSTLRSTPTVPVLSVPVRTLPVPSVPIQSCPVPPGLTDSDRDRLHALAGGLTDPASKTKALEFLGYLENHETIPKERIEETLRKVIAIRGSFIFDNGIPTDKLWRHAIDQTMKYKAIQPSYVGKVMNEAVVKWREGALVV